MPMRDDFSVSTGSWWIQFVPREWQIDGATPVLGGNWADPVPVFCVCSLSWYTFFCSVFLLVFVLTLFFWFCLCVLFLFFLSLLKYM